MKKIVLVVSFLVFLLPLALAQNSCALRLSLLTCAPGAELYSTFGHTAIRVTDSASGVDEVYNYGTFVFDETFYYKFVKGQLLYALSVESVPDFLLQYQAESRSIVEQELALDCAQKTQLYAALRTNALPQNRFYRYDFLFDNCTTRARDMIVANSGGAVRWPVLYPAGQPTFRQLIYVYLNKGRQDWSKFGIDLLLGAKLDREATNLEATFLPDNLLKAMDPATLNGRALVRGKNPLLQMPLVAAESYLITPVVLFSALLLLFGGLSFVPKTWAYRLVHAFDLLLFLVLGAVGLLLLFMWFGTDHKLTVNNYNLVWALPTHLLAVFFLSAKRTWVKTYFRVNAFLLVLLLLLWAFLPQQLNIALLPLILLIAFRSFRISTRTYANAQT